MHARHKWGMFPWKREAFGFIYEFWQQTKSRWWRRGSDFGFSGVWNFMLALSDMIAINTLLQWASLKMSHYRGTEDTVKSNMFSSWLSKIETIGPCYLPNFIVHTSSRVLSNTKTKQSRPKEKKYNSYSVGTIVTPSFFNFLWLIILFNYSFLGGYFALKRRTWMYLNLYHWNMRSYHCESAHIPMDLHD